MSSDEYIATRSASTTSETFGFLQETPVPVVASTPSTDLRQPEPVELISSLLAGTSNNYSTCDDNGPDTSNSSHHFDSTASHHAARAIAYEHIYNHLNGLSATRSLDFRRFPFLELMSDTFTLHAASATCDSISKLDKLVASLALHKDPSPMPLLLAATKASFHGLNHPSTTQYTRTFFATIFPGENSLQTFNSFYTVVLHGLAQYIQTCDLPVALSTEQQVQLSKDITATDWCDFRFLDVVLRCLAATIHTPIILLTASSQFPIMPFIPQDLPLSGLDPLFLVASSQTPCHFCFLTSCSRTPAAATCGPPTSQVATPSLPTSTSSTDPEIPCEQEEVPSTSECAITMAPVLTATAHSTCSCGHSTRQHSACCNQPGRSQSRCPCLRSGAHCTDMCHCRSCQNPHGSKPVLPPAPIELCISKCRCGSASREHPTCSHGSTARKSRCPCLKAGLGCSSSCSCHNCTNPYGTCTITPTLTTMECTRKRLLPPMPNHHTQKRKASDFFSAMQVCTRAGTHSTLEYFLVLSIIEEEFGLLDTDALPHDELHSLYSAAVESITKITGRLAVYPRLQAAVAQLASAVKTQYNFTAIKGLTH